MIAKVLAFAGGVIVAPFLVTALFRVFETAIPVLPVTVAVVVVGVLKGGLWRWAAAGFGVGVIGFEAVILWVLHEWSEVG